MFAYIFRTVYDVRTMLFAKAKRSKSSTTRDDPNTRFHQARTQISIFRRKNEKLSVDFTYVEVTSTCQQR